MTEHADTPPVAGETTAVPYVSRCIVCGKPGDQHPDGRWCGSEQYVTGDWTDIPIVNDVARAIGSAFHCGDDAWTTEALAAIAAARPHLTAERDAETTDLRDRLASTARTVDNLRDVITAKDAENTALRAQCAAITARLDEMASAASRRAGGTYSIVDARAHTAHANALMALAEELRTSAVLADPAPSTERLDADQLPVDRVEKLAQWLHGRNIGICEMDDDTVYNGIDSMRSLAQALLQHGPDGIRITTPEAAAETTEQSDEDEIDRFHPDYCRSEMAEDNRHSPEYFKRGFLCAWCHADPAPSTPAAQENQA